MPIEITLDTCGPMTANVRDNALLLEVIAGPDGLDPRQYDAAAGRYTDALDGGVKGMRIGVLKEGFGHANREPDVDAKVARRCATLARRSARRSTRCRYQRTGSASPCGRRSGATPPALRCWR